VHVDDALAMRNSSVPSVEKVEELIVDGEIIYSFVNVCFWVKQSLEKKLRNKKEKNPCSIFLSLSFFFFISKIK
jgi:hypothetical protein